MPGAPSSRLSLLSWPCSAPNPSTAPSPDPRHAPRGPPLAPSGQCEMAEPAGSPPTARFSAQPHFVLSSGFSWDVAMETGAFEGCPSGLRAPTAQRWADKRDPRVIPGLDTRSACAVLLCSLSVGHIIPPCLSDPPGPGETQEISPGGQGEARGSLELSAASRASGRSLS